MKDFKNLGFDDYLSIIWRRRWYMALTAVLLASVVAAVVWQMPSLYKSEAKVMVETPFVSEDFVRPVIRSTPADRINSIREQIASRTFLERIVEQLQIAGYGNRADFVMEDAVKLLRKQIGIEKTSEDTFSISFTATDPQSAREVTKRLVDELIRSSTASRMDKTMATDQFLDEQLRQAAQALSAQEEKVKQYKSAHLGELPEQSNANTTALSGLYAQLTATENALQQARDQQKQLDYKLQEQKRINLLAQSVANTESSRRPAAGGTVISSPEAELAAKKADLAAMLMRYTPKHPDVAILSRQIEDLERKISEQKTSMSAVVSSDPESSSSKSHEGASATLESATIRFESESIKNQIDKREKEKADIQRQIKVFQARLNLAPTMEQELSALLRDAEILKERYANLQNKKFNSQMAATVENDKKNETYKIIDEPNLPLRSEYPNRLQFILLGIVGGLVLGIGTAIGRELMDPTVGSEDEARAAFNLPVLVSIWDIPPEGKPIRKLLRQKEGVA
jgi:polysaccharide chain length determinant protein (PEP-CTERM system associated)